MWQGWINLALGIWLMLSGQITTLQNPLNLIIVGLLASVFGFWTYKDLLSITSGIMGLFTIISGVWLDLISPATFLIIGVLLGSCGFWVGFAHSKPTTPHTF